LFWVTAINIDIGQRVILESIARGADLKQVLNEIVLLIERQLPVLRGSILLLEDGKYLRHGAAPHLPEPFSRAIDGTEIGPMIGSCGAAAYRREPVIVDDIATHPNWAQFREFALPHGLRACWSTPIFSPQGVVLGTFAMYYPEPRGPTPQELGLVGIATHLASIAISHDWTARELRRSEKRARELARLHAVASSINKLILRPRDSKSVYDVACEVAVEQGLARFAWVGLLDETKQRLDVVAQYGKEEVLGTRTLILDDRKVRGGMLERALKTGECQVAGDLLIDGHPDWREVITAHGLRSCAMFPLVDADRLFGIVALYAENVNYFREEEVQVLTSLASDISFGVESARKDQERQRMAEAVRSSEKLRSLIFSTVADGIYYVQVEGKERYRFVSANPAFLEMFGVTEDEIIGKVMNDYLPQTVYDHVMAQYRRACKTSSKVTWEQVVESRGGRRHVEVTIAPIYDAKGECTHFVGTIHDVTARAQAESERAVLVAQLNQAQRMQALGTLAGGIAHDFNNILAAIAGNTGLALQEPALSDNVRTHLLEIKKASQRAIELVRQILTFSRNAPSKRERVDPVEVTREALNLLRATLRDSVAIATQFAADMPSFEGDPTQYHQIIMNLVTNAAHALPQRDGLIRVKLDRVHVDDQSLPVANLAAGDYLRIQVIDNGCGMDEATLKRAFDPFFTTRKPGEGTGLGLSVVHGIVQGHGGAIDIRSKLNEGTTVTVFLPLNAASAEVEKPQAVALAQGGGERIMYVDDEEALVFLMDRALTKMGYRVRGFSDPAAALAAFRAQPDDFDVVITDISMPGMSGSHLASQVRQISADIPIIMTSGYIRSEDIANAKRLQINQLVYKANTIEELGQALAKEIAALKNGSAHRVANG
jgi:PAS domain S-box-containing protein